MRIRYEVSLDDLIAFQEHFYSRNPIIRRQLKIGKWSGAAVIAAVGLICPTLYPFMAGVVGGSVAAYAISLTVSSLGAAGYLVWYPALIRRRIRKFSQRFYREGSNRTVFGKQELEVEPDGLVSRTQYSEAKVAWGALEKIESVPGYTFLFLGTAAAYVIRHDSVTDGNMGAFLTELGARFQPDALLQPTSITPAD